MRSFRPLPSSWTIVLGPKRTWTRRKLATTPRAAIARDEQRFGLPARQEVDDTPGRLLAWNRQDASRQIEPIGTAERHEPKERPERREASVPRAAAIVSIRFEVIEKGQDDRHVEGVERHLVGRDLPVLLQEGEEEPHGITIRGHGLRTDLLLSEQIVSEECADERSERDGGTHSVTLAATNVSKRSAAGRRTSGVAVRYQYVSWGRA